MLATEVVVPMRKDIYCCYRHFAEGRERNEQTHCYSHVQKGLILPEGTVGIELKRKISQQKLAKTIQQESKDQMQIVGKGICLRQFGTDIIADGAKESLPLHLRNPFVYCDKVYQRGSRPQTSKEDRDQFLVAAESSCRRHLRHDLEIEQQLKGFTKEQRREFFSRVFVLPIITQNLTESLYNFYGQVHSCLEQRLFEKQLKPTVRNPTLQQLFEEYCRQRNIDLSKRHQLLMVDESQCKGFLRELGFPVKQHRLIDQFWELVFRQGIFEDYQIATSGTLGRTNRRTSRVISMKAFFYNYKKFFADRERYVFVFSPNMLRQRMIDLRFAVHPWAKQYRLLDERLRDLRPVEFSICEKLSNTNKQLSEELLRTIEERNSTCFKLRTLAKYYYQLLSSPTVTFEGMHSAFLERLNRIREQMSVFQDFLEAFRNFRRDLASRQPAFDQLTVQATDLADFLAYSKMEASKAELVIRWISKFYKYLHFFKGEEQVHYNPATGKTSLSSNIQFNYDELSEFLHYKTAKVEDEQNIVNDFLLRLEEFHRVNVEGVDLSRSREVFEQNVLAEFFLREMRVDLASFEKLLAIVKIGTEHGDSEPYSVETVKEIERHLLRNTATSSFTLKFLFSDRMLAKARECEACNVEPTAASENQSITDKGTEWRSKIQRGRQLFSEQLDSLQHVLLDWNTIIKQSAVAAYPNVRCVRTQEVRIEEPAAAQQEEEKHKDFKIKYVEVPKEKIYKVKVTKHEHREVSAQQAIFDEETRPPKQKPQAEPVEVCHNCPVCEKKFPASQLSVTLTTSTYCPCICTDGVGYSFFGTESDLTARSVTEMQDQLMRLLNL